MGTFLYTLIFKILLEINYIFFVVPKFSYNRFFLDINIWKLIEAYISFFILYFLIPKYNKNIASSFLFYLFSFIYIPINSYYFLTNNYRSYYYIVTIVFFIVSIILTKDKIRKNKKYKIQKDKLYILFNLYLGIGIIFIVYSIVNIGKINLQALLLKDIYLIRGKLDLQGFEKYLVPWMGNIIIPSTIIYNYINKKKLFFIIGILLQIVYFTIFPFKTFLFVAFFMIGNLYIFKSKNLYKNFILLLNIVIGISMISYYIYNQILLISMIVRRIFFVPAQLNFLYYDYIQNEGKYLFYSESKIGKIFGLLYPYEIDFSHYIGNLYFPGTGTGSNTGVFAEVYVNLGLFGIIFVGIILIIILKLLNRVESNKGYIFSLVSYYSIAFSNSGILTILLTHGFFICIIIILFNMNIKIKID